MRIDKLLVNLKYGTRKEIQYMIRKERVTVNGVIVKDKGLNIDPKNDVIMLDDERVYYIDNVLLMMNKPSGYVCANHDSLHETVIDLIGPPYNRIDWKIVGRLDIDTEGLLLLTNDGQLVHSLISPKKDVYKKYLVKVKNPLKNPDKLTGNYQIKDGKNELYTPAESFIEMIDDTTFYLSIKEGKFHQVKRMVGHFRNEVTYLKRVSIGDIILDKNLKTGEYKEIELKKEA